MYTRIKAYTENAAEELMSQNRVRRAGTCAKPIVESELSGKDTSSVVAIDHGGMQLEPTSGAIRKDCGAIGAEGKRLPKGRDSLELARKCPESIWRVDKDGENLAWSNLSRQIELAFGMTTWLLFEVRTPGFLLQLVYSREELDICVYVDRNDVILTSYKERLTSYRHPTKFGAELFRHDLPEPNLRKYPNLVLATQGLFSLTIAPHALTKYSHRHVFFYSSGHLRREFKAT
ncbi:hypothetical protein EV421DRAFT_2013940 [Armillaria borealis]|uniref:Uncharacterized protein n=1 Tax=Armillaria borealis TaxID=47425 RepID=A0AA39KDT2_9AGAR|nr:hypothetical protein EV421DRAFT_2013940 [Armillaria borealis]